MKIIDCFDLAVKNVATHGDTDVFPYPVDNAIFNDSGKEVVDLLDAIEKTPKFETNFNNYHVTSATHLVAAGYTGFRPATQIDPLWNAYLLGVVISMGQDIEKNRVSTNRNNVFSYRFAPDTKSSSLFQKNIGWYEYQIESVKRAQSSQYVVACDISDFYSRIYHHRLENALHRASDGNHLIGRVMAVLKELSKGTSYGLPVGGPASRLLSELLLNTTDKLLEINEISFVRFVDDYYLFANTKHEAYRHLIFLSEKLQQNEGLSLQKAKTRIMTAKEFLATSDYSKENEPSTEEEKTLRKFRSLRLYYDPYSLTAVEDYRTLKDALAEFDIVGMLQAEFRKSRIHQPTTKKLLSAIRHLDVNIRSAAVKTVIENMEMLSPVFPNVTVLLKDVVQENEEEINREVFTAIHSLFKNDSPLISLPINISYCLRILAYDNSMESETLLNSIFNKTESTMLRRDIINVMTYREAHYWLSDKLKNYGSSTQWEKRALLISSYVLTDEGKHWRSSLKNMSGYEKIIKEWAQDRKQKGKKGLPI